jgi:3-deoxy-manno-octulosonate cytidylyltransferase (CMP-KDO synthetase)
MAFHVIIPARLQSTRLPGKVLLPIADKPMLQHVYERAVLSGALSVVIATDDNRVADTARAFGAKVCMTNPAHSNGTARIEEAIRLLAWPEDTVVVGVQADEPMMPPSLIQQVAGNVLVHPQASMTTLSMPIEHSDDLHNSNVVKVVTDKDGYALYFSRAPIPFARDSGSDLPHPYPLRHVGLYAYRAGFLQQYIAWPPAPVETVESLEQLRVLWNGHRIHVALAQEPPGIGVDTQEDWVQVCDLMTARIE